MARLVAGHDAVISAFNPGWSNPDIYNQQVKGARSIINGVKKAGVKRLLFVGGAGSLEVKPGVQSVDLPEFPAEYKQGALATREALNLLRKEPSLDWSFLSPSADLFPGQRTGKFRLGTDQLLDGCKGRKPHLGRGLCDGDDRRGGEAEAYPPSLYRGLLSCDELDALNPGILFRSHVDAIERRVRLYGVERYGSRRDPYVAIRHCLSFRRG